MTTPAGTYVFTYIVHLDLSHERNWVDCLPKTEQFAKLYLLDDKTDQNTNLPCQISYLYRYTLFSQIWVNEKKLRKQNSSLFLTLIVHILINVHRVPFERQITNWFCIEQQKSDHFPLLLIPISFSNGLVLWGDCLPMFATLTRRSIVI